ncbi:hypothetical protein K8R47_00815 [archaeon]|nr:hypothetical protein [archaeon]
MNKKIFTIIIAFILLFTNINYANSEAIQGSGITQVVWNTPIDYNEDPGLREYSYGEKLYFSGSVIISSSGTTVTSININFYIKDEDDSLWTFLGNRDYSEESSYTYDYSFLTPISDDLDPGLAEVRAVYDITSDDGSINENIEIIRNILINAPINAPDMLTTEFLTNPPEVFDPNPEFGWDPSGLQTYYRIKVDTSNNFNGLRMWDSDKVYDNSFQEISYGHNSIPKPLDWGETYYWKVKTWQNNLQSQYSVEEALFTMRSFPYGHNQNFQNPLDPSINTNPSTTTALWVSDEDGYVQLNPTGWSNEIIDFGGDVGKFTSLAFDSNDIPHISYNDNTNDDLKYAKYVSTNGNCGPSNSWQCTTIDSGGDVGKWTSIAVDSNDNIHISYYDLTNKDLKYAYYDGSWDILTIDDIGDKGMYSSIAVDSNDNPHISYMKENNPYPGFTTLKYAYYDGLWYSDISTGAPPFNSGGYTSIEIDSNDNIYIAYLMNALGGMVYVDYYDADTEMWYPNHARGGNANGYISLDLDSNDNPHISFKAGWQHELWYAQGPSLYAGHVFDDIGWPMGWHNSLILDSNDNTHISSRHSSNNDLMYFYTTEGNYHIGDWTMEVVDGGDAGRYSSIALTSGDKPCISYYGDATQDLKFSCQQFSTTESQSIESNTITTEPIYQAAIYASEYLSEGTSIIYYLSADDGQNWVEAIPGYPSIISGNNLKWKAELSTINQFSTPVLGSIGIDWNDNIIIPVCNSPLIPIQEGDNPCLSHADCCMGTDQQPAIPLFCSGGACCPIDTSWVEGDNPITPPIELGYCGGGGGFDCGVAWTGGGNPFDFNPELEQICCPAGWQTITEI